MDLLKKAKEALRDNTDFPGRDLAELRHEWCDKLERAKALLDGNPTTRQRAEGRGLLDEVDEIRRVITKLDVRRYERWGERSTCDPDREIIGLDGEVAPSGGSGKTVRFRDQDGKEIRGVRHGESFRSAVGCGRPASGFGKLIRDLALGRNTHENRDYYSSSDVSGGYLLHSEMSSLVIDLARSRSVMSEVGVMTIPMSAAEMKVASVDSDPTAAWVGERDLIPESEGSFGLRTLKAKNLAAYCTVSMELLEDAANSESLIESTIAKAIAAKLDETFLNGNGDAIRPMGLLHSDMVTARPIDAGLSYDVLLKACRALWQNNVEAEALVMSPEMRTELALLKDGEGNYHQPPPEIAAIKRFTSSQLEDDGEGLTAYVGSFGNVLVGMRDQVRLEVSPHAGDVFQRRQVAIRAVLRCDILPARSGDILKLTGIVATD